jgi:hypothetical protein
MSLAMHASSRVGNDLGWVTWHLAQTFQPGCSGSENTAAPLLLLLLLLLALQELDDMITDECTFKADGVLYTSDLKGASYKNKCPLVSSCCHPISHACEGPRLLQLHLFP